jgi:hypothetical protein
MLKITLKNGIVIEGTNPNDLLKFIKQKEETTTNEKTGEKRSHVEWKKDEVKEIYKTLHLSLKEVRQIFPYRPASSISNLRAGMRKGKVGLRIRKILNAENPDFKN